MTYFKKTKILIPILTIFFFLAAEAIGVLPAAGIALAQTVPTATPKPSGGGGGGGGGSTSPTATNTPPAATPTATTPAVTIAPTPVDGFVTPEVCGPPLYQASNGSVNVRSIPATAGEIVGQLVYLEVRPIIGRAADVTWWRITLANGDEGWVSDPIGTVYGNIDALPIVDDDGRPVDSGQWNPTPNPICPTSTPTATPLPPTETPSATPSLVASATATAETPSPTATLVPSETATTPPTPSPTSTEIAAADPSPAATETVLDNDVTQPEPAGSNWFLIGGTGLVLAGLAGYILQKLRE